MTSIKKEPPPRKLLLRHGGFAVISALLFWVHTPALHVCGKKGSHTARKNSQGLQSEHRGQTEKREAAPRPPAAVRCLEFCHLQWPGRGKEEGVDGRPCFCSGSAADTRDLIRSQSRSGPSAQARLCPSLWQWICSAQPFAGWRVGPLSLSGPLLTACISEIKGLIPLVPSVQTTCQLKRGYVYM